MADTTPHLWEYDHPFYCGTAKHFKSSDGKFNHAEFPSWQDFVDNTGFTTGDRDMNLLVRWDWISWRRHPDPELRCDTEPDQLCLYFVAQRKGYLTSQYIAVTDADEPAVRAFLTECAAVMAATWAPLLTTALPPTSRPTHEER